MKEFFGWDRASDMAAVYVHLSGRDVDNAILGVYGLKEAKESQQPLIKIEPCPRCKEPNSPESLFCIKCGLPLKEKSTLALDKAEDIIIELLKRALETSPEIKKQLVAIVKEKGAESLFLQ